MDQTRSVCVLFVDICESTKLYESVGDKMALEAIARCLEIMRKAVEGASGRVIKTIGDEVLAVFPSPEMGVFAANAMHTAVDQLPLVGTAKLALRTGMHYGPVIQQQADIFGDSVNLAARLVKQAAMGQIIVSGPTADMLPAAFSAFKRPLYAIEVKGKAEKIQLCEIIWQARSDLTVSETTRTSIRIKPLVLRLVYGDLELVRQRKDEVVVIGRDSGCNLVVESSRASRKHCTIFRRQDKYILADQSTNGTFVTPEGDAEIELRREEFMLGGHGWISIGQSRDEAELVIEYFCE